MVSWDTKKQLICVQQNLRHNPLINPNQVLSAVKVLKSLPKSYIYQYLNIESLTESFHKPLVESLGKWFVKPFPFLSHTEAFTENGNVDNFVDNPENQKTDQHVDNSTLKTKTDEDIKQQIEESLNIEEPEQDETGTDIETF